MTLRLFLAALIAGSGAAVPWSGPTGDRSPRGGYTIRQDTHPGVPMKWLASLFLVFALGEPLAAQDPEAPKPKFKRQPNVIVIEEIDAIRHEVSTAHDIVLRLRPNFLRTRGATSLGNAARSSGTPAAQVVVDGAPRGAVSALAQIPAITVREVRYLNAADASIQYGTGYDGGAILVFTR